MNFIITWLAGLFSAFKIKNPLVASVVLLVLSALVHTVHQGSVLGLFQVGGWLQTALEFVSLFLTSAVGSQTWQYLNPGSANH